MAEDAVAEMHGPCRRLPETRGVHRTGGEGAHATDSRMRRACFRFLCKPTSARNPLSIIVSAQSRYPGDFWL